MKDESKPMDRSIALLTNGGKYAAKPVTFIAVAENTASEASNNKNGFWFDKYWHKR